MKPTILTIAAHPDDEVLGCGGTMARFAEEGHEVHVLILAEGLTSRDDTRDRDSKLGELSLLATTAKEANILLGLNSIKLHDFPDNRMDSVDRLDVVKVIEKKMEEIQPSIIFTHFGNDLNIDHRIANDAVVTACRSFPGQMVKELYFYEVPSSTEWQISSGQFGFQPNLFISLTNDQINKKRKALEIYNSEMRDFPHSRSIQAVEALAKWRGASCGHTWAEAFVVGRILR
jgi:N-acetylglucosamine malate deacetylase 1